IVTELRQPNLRKRIERLRTQQWLTPEMPLRECNRIKPCLLSLMTSPRQVAGSFLGENTAGYGTLLMAKETIWADVRCHVEYEFHQLALLLAAYRADEGEFPERLTQLVPKYAQQLPE